MKDKREGKRNQETNKSSLQCRALGPSTIKMDILKTILVIGTQTQLLVLYRIKLTFFLHCREHPACKMRNFSELRVELPEAGFTEHLSSNVPGNP